MQNRDEHSSTHRHTLTLSRRSGSSKTSHSRPDLGGASGRRKRAASSSPYASRKATASMTLSGPL